MNWKLHVAAQIAFKYSSLSGYAISRSTSIEPK